MLYNRTIALSLQIACFSLLFLSFSLKLNIPPSRCWIGYWFIGLVLVDGLVFEFFRLLLDWFRYWFWLLDWFVIGWFGGSFDWLLLDWFLVWLFGSCPIRF